MLIAGAIVALACAILSAVGAFAPLERFTLDARFAHAQPSSRVLSDDIRLVEIDDGAIESVGRWPWPRSFLADAIDELRLAGAKVVALDLLLDDPSAPEYAPLPDDPSVIVRIDHDAALARALAQTTAVLAVDEPFRFDDFEREFLGNYLTESVRAVERLRADITMSERGPDAAPEYLIPDDMSARRFQALAAFSVAVERRAGLAPDEPDDLETLLRQLSPGVDENVGDFPERRLIERAAEHARSLHIFASTLGLTLPDRVDAHAALDLDRLTPPTPTLAFGATSFGYVNFDADPDGSPRRMPLVRSKPLGDIPQFGLAAASAFLGIDPTGHAHTDRSLTFVDRRIPLRDGKILVSWPSPDAFEARGDEQRMSLGVLVSIARNRRTLERLHEHRASLAASIQTIDPAQVDDASLAAVRDIASLRLAEMREILDTGEELTDEEREYLAPFERFDQVERAIAHGGTEFDHSLAELRRRVEGKLCFVGWSGSGALADFVPTPLGDRTPGVVLHATIADNLLTGRVKSLAPRWLDPLLTFSLALLGALVVATLPTALSVLAFAGIGLAYLTLAGFVAFRFGDVALPLAGPALGLVNAWALCTALDAAASRLERARIQRQFKSRVAPQLVERLAANPNALAVEGQAREITVLFLDVAGFTSLSEKLDGPQTVALINDCMRAFTAALTKADAYVNKFLGDGLMAFWSAFADDPEQADKAVVAAAACLDAIERVNDHRRATDPDAPPLSVRVGVATGVAIVGDCGAPPELNDYTAIGNAVNLASRLEGACKAFGARAIIDGRTRELMRREPPRSLRRLGRVVVIGQTVPVEVFELPTGALDDRRAAQWTAALDDFEKGDFDACLRELDAFTRAYGDDPACSRLRESIEDLREHDDAPGEPRSIRLRSK